jgi:dihydroorotate dehydrogenase (NAD+) catalytic subunit
MAVELGFAPLLAGDILALVVEMCRGELPLVVSLPSEQVLALGGRLLELGAAALSLGTPRGALPNGEAILTGRLFGPALFPMSLDVVRSAARLGLPIIGGGGVCSQADAQAMLSAGALAVQLDSSLWLP